MEQTKRFKWKRLPLLILGLLALAVFLGKAAFDLYWFYQVKWQPLALIVERAASPLEPASGRLYETEVGKAVEVVISPQRTLDGRLVLLVKRIKGNAAKIELAKGDVIFEVNGSPLTRWDDTLTKRTAEGVTFTVMRRGTPEQVHLQLRGARGSPEFLESFGISTQTFYSWFALGALGLSMLVMGLLVYLKSETQPATLLLLMGIALTPFMGILIRNLPFLQEALLPFIVPAMGFSASFLLHFLLIFPQKKKIVEKLGRAVYFIYIPSIVSVLAICLIYAAMGKRGAENSDAGRIIGISSALLFLLYGILGFIALLHSYKRTTSPVVKGQTRTLLFGFGVVFAPILIYFIFGIFSDFILKKGPPPDVIASAIPAFLLAIPLSFGYAILRQGMLDVNFVIAKSVSYLAITVMAVGLYLGIVMGVGKGLLALTGEASQTLTIGATLLVAVLFAPMQSWTRRAIDRKFYRARYDAHELLAQFSRDLPSMMELPDILSALTERLTSALHPRSLFILLPSPSGEEFIVVETTGDAPGANPLKRDESRLLKLLQETRRPFVCYQLDAVAQSLTEADIALLRVLETVLCVPMLVQERLVGILNLGFKRAELPYNSEDLTLLATVAGSAAIAVENARLSAQKAEQERRVQAEKMATLVTLAGGVAHEINNPMDAILGSVQRILRFAEDSQKVRESAQSAQEGVRRCKAIVENLLKYAQQFKDEFAVLDVNQVIQDTAALLEQKFQFEQINLEMQLTPGLKVQGNFTELSQVVTNLLTNAKDAIVAARATGVTLPVDGEGRGGVIIVRTAIENNEILIEVVDNGIGIEEEHLGKLFDPFFTTKPVGKGTGLGLSICQGIVEKHYGRMEVSSKVGEGATFRVFLPIQ